MAHFRRIAELGLLWRKASLPSPHSASIRYPTWEDKSLSSQVRCLAHRCCTPLLIDRGSVVAGGNVGIGYETTKVSTLPGSRVRAILTRFKALLQHNAKVYLAARSKDKADAAIASLKEATGKEAIFLELDLSSLASIKKAAEEFLGKERELHMLFNNA